MASKPLPPRTDAGNAEGFAAKYGDLLRFDHSHRRWLYWSGERWEEDTLEGVLLLAKSAARHRLELVAKCMKDDEKDFKAEVAWCIESEQRHRIRAALDLARAERPLSTSGEEFDKDQWLLGVENGVVDLRTGNLREARREDWITRSTRFPFDERAGCPRFEQFLCEIFEYDRELIEFVWRAIGYSLTGSVNEQCFFACHGSGANGKSKLLGTLHYVLGDYALNLPFSTFELKQRSAIPNDLVRLESRRYVTALESAEGVQLNEQRIKTLTGGDPITARLLYKEFVTFDPTHKLWLAFNHKPIITDDTPAIWRRVRLIPFNHKFEGQEDDKDLLEKLKAEASGILASAVRACLEWQQGGLGTPRAVAEATSEYQEESDQVAAFLGEVCTVEECKAAPCSDLFSRYVKWTEQSGENPMTRMAFSERLEGKGFRKKRRGHENVWVWLGIGLLGTPVEPCELRLGDSMRL
ncbi:MAG TPA: phage/plasmid primase, P4 family [Verrucomicrobiae bacterium]|nr:phage/plasmid primase, P4 family [Verrucomicrobiae bacterium]HUN63799.1 phage/plasmid primase, P4 family [Candidatus Sulfotelmatobacter sp.]